MHDNRLVLCKIYMCEIEKVPPWQVGTECKHMPPPPRDGAGGGDFVQRVLHLQEVNPLSSPWTHSVKPHNERQSGQQSIHQSIHHTWFHTSVHFWTICSSERSPVSSNQLLASKYVNAVHIFWFDLLWLSNFPNAGFIRAFFIFLADVQQGHCASL